MRRRRVSPVAPYDVDASAAVERLRDELDDVRRLLRDSRNETSAARVQLAAERRNVARLQGEVRAGAALVAAAERQCGETCAHGRVVKEQRIQMAAMQERLDVLTNASVQRDRLDFAARNKSADWEPRPTVPRQRGTT